MTHDRRSFLALFSRLGLTTTLFPGALWAMADGKAAISKDMITEAATVAGIDFSDAEKEMMLGDLNGRVQQYRALHDLHIPNSVPPAVEFNPVLPGTKLDAQPSSIRLSRIVAPATPKNIEEVAFYSVRQLSELVRTKKVSSAALTDMYLGRLKRYDPVLKFVITLTEERARAQAKEADREIVAGKYRGPLHGLPWGAKDLLAVKSYPTTWGAGGMEKQVVDEDATVVRRLDEAGAVLVAKLTLGALAMGDKWFGGMTRNPWSPKEGSSGSSAGSASATAAGCVAFAIGSETLGSIASPSTVCGATGLRPTFGRVPRTGAMALSWSMDKLGPLCRAAEDCALVLAAIHGPDGKDRTAQPAGFSWDAALDIRKLRVGWLKSDFDRLSQPRRREDEKQKVERENEDKLNRAALEAITGKLGLKLIPVEMPNLPWDSMRVILEAEAGAAFDDFLRNGKDKLLTEQGRYDWPNTFRASHLIPAVEYINANRARRMGMEQMATLFKQVDVIVAPSFGGSQLMVTNVTGHPALIMPSGFRADGTPASLTFIGDLFGEGRLCALGKTYQDATGWHLKHPQNLTI